MKALDVREYREKGRRLMEVIDEVLEETQGWNPQPYPDEIVMTEAQFESLRWLSCIDLEADENPLLTTAQTVMEVEIR